MTKILLIIMLTLFPSKSSNITIHIHCKIHRHCDEMPTDYIEFDERFRSEAARCKLSKEAFRDQVHGYAVPLVKSVCGNDKLCTMTRTVIGGFHICIFFDISLNGPVGMNKWVLRVPIPGQHGGNLLGEKFRSEVATMKLVHPNICLTMEFTNSGTYTFLPMLPFQSHVSSHMVSRTIRTLEGITL